MKTRNVLPVALLISIIFGMMMFLGLDIFKWAPERQVRERQEQMQVFLDTFGAELPRPEERGSAQPAVVEKLLHLRRRLSDVRKKEHAISSAWEDTTISTPEGVAKRLTLQKKYDEAKGERAEAEKVFKKACRLARDADFNEEVRALACP